MRDARRPLSFAALEEVMPDVDRLMRGHTTVGHWSLGQICSHLAQAFRFTVDGFPPRLSRRGSSARRSAASSCGTSCARAVHRRAQARVPGEAGAGGLTATAGGTREWPVTEAKWLGAGECLI